MAAKKITTATEPRRLVISDNLVATLGGPKPRPPSPFLESYDPNPFKLPQFPTGVGPKKGNGLAMDEADGQQAMLWAGGMVNPGYFRSAVEEGQAFLGFPYLAILAQRPEYRRITETIARNTTRAWVKLRSKGNKKADKISEIDDEMKRLKVRQHFRVSAELDGFFGRGHIYVDVDDAIDNNDELRQDIGTGKSELSKRKIAKGAKLRLQNLEPVWCYPTKYESSNPLKADWYKPKLWYAMAQEIHASRLLTFVGRPVPDLLKPAYAFGGVSLSQMAKPYIDNWLKTRQSVADIISAFSVMVFSTRLIDQAGSQDSEANLVKRVDLFNRSRDNRGLIIIDKESEEFKNISAPIAGLHELQSQSQEQIASVSGIPIVELLGIQPSGLNASSEGELEAWREWIRSAQEALFREPLETIIHFIQLSKWGDIDEDILVEFNPLAEMTEKEQAEILGIKANTDAVLVDTGGLTGKDVRQRLIDDPQSGYNDLKLDDPDLPPSPGELAEQGQGMGGQQQGEQGGPPGTTLPKLSRAVNIKSVPFG